MKVSKASFQVLDLLEILIAEEPEEKFIKLQVKNPQELETKNLLKKFGDEKITFKI